MDPYWAYALLVALLWATGNVLMKTTSRDIPVRAGFVVYSLFTAAGALAFAAYHWRTLRADLAGMRPRHALAISLAVAVNPIIATLLFFTLLDKHPIAHVMPLAYTAPLFAMLLAALFLQEALRPMVLLGASLIVAGCAVCVRANASPR